MNNTELSIRYAQGAEKGKGSNLFIDGDTIYSYGYHFKIATRYHGFYLFNSNGYSSSTAKHQNHVCRELPINKRIDCPNCDIELAEEHLKKMIEWVKGKQSRARKTDYSSLLEIQNQMLRNYYQVKKETK